jgi:hypothetical protein
MKLYRGGVSSRLMAAATTVIFMLTPITDNTNVQGDWTGQELILSGDQELSRNSPGIGAVAKEPKGPAGPESIADPYIYEYRDACTDGDSRNFDNCISVVATCSTGGGESGTEPGRVLYRYKSRADVTPPAWTFDSGPQCVHPDKPAEKPIDILAEIAASIAHEFQRSPVVAASIGSQPGPHTLRGKETNVWAEATTQTFNLTMLGQKVTITATPVAYTWNYGDGTIWGPTPTHGAPLHKDRIGEQTQTSHIYTNTGHLTINLTTHFNGSYTVNNGPALPIPGQGNIPSPPLPLTVWRAETNLYADNCFQNPQGIGC